MLKRYNKAPLVGACGWGLDAEGIVCGATTPYDPFVIEAVISVVLVFELDDNGKKPDRAGRSAQQYVGR